MRFGVGVKLFLHVKYPHVFLIHIKGMHWVCLIWGVVDRSEAVFPCENSHIFL